MIRQIAQALDYLHQNHICHRDVKPENIIFVNGPPDVADGRCKLVDFGTATPFSNAAMLQQPFGSPNYIAPEVLLRHYREKCDLWSLGIILFVLLSLQQPFRGRTDAEVLKQVAEAPVRLSEAKKHRSAMCMDLLKRLLCKDPE